MMVVLLDGGFSSQVKKYADNKVLTESPLWCAQFLSTAPDAVLNTHCDYINAGSEVITTNTYQASVDGFQQHLGLDLDGSKALIRQAVTLAHQAVDMCGRQVMVAGSVGPYGACLHDGSEYRGDYVESVTSQQLRDWHRPRIAALVAAGVHLLAIETIPAVQEATAILVLLREEFPSVKAWVSFSCKDESHGELFAEAVSQCCQTNRSQLVAVGVNCLVPALVSPLLTSAKDEAHTSHGELFSEAVSQCCQTNRSQLVAVGVNCLAPALVSPLLTSVKGLQVPFVVYPNSGETWTPVLGWTGKERCLPLVHYLPEWLSLGAQYVGGCCQTDADDIRQCREFIDKNNL